MKPYYEDCRDVVSRKELVFQLGRISFWNSVHWYGEKMGSKYEDVSLLFTWGLIIAVIFLSLFTFVGVVNLLWWLWHLG